MTEDIAVEQRDWLIESKVSRDGDVLAITSGTDGEGRGVFFVCEAEGKAHLSVDEREYGVVYAAYEESVARDKLQKLSENRDIESNIITE